MAMPLWLLLGAVLAAPPAPPPTTCIPEAGTGVLTVSPMRADGAPPAIPNPLAAWTGKELLLWPRRKVQPDDPAAPRWKGWGWAYSPSADRWRRLSGPGRPPSRSNASLTWTGTTAILWGGPEGFAFHPATGRSRAISGRGAPSPRSEHAAAWTGSELIVWGGLGDGGLLCDGGRYDPSKDAWTPIPPPPGGAPCEGLSGRAGLATWAGGRLVVVLTRGEKLAAFAYQPGGGWTAIPEEAAPDQLFRYELEAGPDGFAYAAGTQATGGVQGAYIYRLDFQRRAWLPVAPACGIGQLALIGGVLAQLGSRETCLYDVASGGCRVLVELAPLGVDEYAAPQVAVSTGAETLLWRGSGAIVRVAGGAKVSTPAPTGAGQGALVRGRASVTRQVHCGGMAPRPGEVTQTTEAATGKKLLVRQGSKNGGRIVAEVTTDRLGLFELRLPPGVYCLVEEGKRDLSPAGALPSHVDARCLQQWRAACDSTLEVQPGQAEAGAGVHFHEQCFGRCYTGPLPP